MRDERRLARRAARGDRDAFTAIFRRFQQDLYRYCVAILGNPEDAQDALQNTMVKALGALPGERREIDLKPWLYRIAHNESIELIRRRGQNVSLEEDRLPLGASLAEEVETRQRLRQLIADVGELPERQRGALLMREAGGLEFEEIAAALGTTAAVARQTLYEARLGLREMDAGRNMECTAVTKALSDGDRRTRRRRDIGAHLKGCSECRAFAEQIDSRRHALASISPLPAVAAAALLKGLGGGGAGVGVAAGTGSSTAGGVGGAVGAGATKAIGTATLLKGAATVAAAAAIGVGGADVAGLIHPGGASSRPEAGPVEASGRQGDPASPGSGSGATERPASDGIAQDVPTAANLASARPRRPDSAPAHASSVAASEPAAEPSPRGDPEPTIAAPESEPTTAPSPEATEELPPGADHPKQLPPSAAHGQETAAANKGKPKPATSNASGHPAHPEHPATPSTPEASEPAPSPTPTTGATEGPPPEEVAAEPTEEVEAPPPGQSGTAPGQEKRNDS